MKLEVDEEYNIVAKETYNPLVLETNEGFSINICMRDFGFDIMVPNFNKHIHIDDSGNITERYWKTKEEE